MKCYDYDPFYLGFRVLSPQLKVLKNKTCVGHLNVRIFIRNISH